MAIRWICTKCKAEVSDGIPIGGFNLKEGEKEPIPVDWDGICPLCEGKLKSIADKK